MTARRALDLTLVILVSPAWVLATALLAILVFLVDGRPVLFAQTRLGRGRERFRILKLRTMVDGRPTRLGQWLRARGLDELPQIWNVARGEMSLVGPRPLSEPDADRLTGLHPEFAARFAQPPGLTGLAQVCQARGAELTARLDAHYARHRSVAMDLGILFRTVFIHLVGKRRGARAMP